MVDEHLAKNLTHIAVLLALVIGLLGALIFTGVVGCNIIPGGCDAYYIVLKGGSPNVLIAYGETGLGDSTKLENVLRDRDLLGSIRVTSMNIDRLSKGNITDYDLIIVEQAKQICTEKLKLFEDYIVRGGRLVWTGDAGTEKCEGDEYLLESERSETGEEKIFDPWARKDGGKQVSFDELIGVSYKANYCELAKCTPGEEIGRIEITNDQHKLTKGLSPTLKFRHDFSIVELNKGGTVRLVATLDYGTDLLGEADKPWLSGRTNFGKTLTFIASSQIGERVAYYATPIENFVEGDEPYKALIEQMYYGMLYN